MKTKIIPFDLETAKKIQAGEIGGRIKTRDLKHTMNIVCYDSTARYCGDLLPIIAQDIEDCESFLAYFKDGAYIKEEENPRDLVLEVPDNEPQFKPFDKVLVRGCDGYCSEISDFWTPAYYQRNAGEHLHLASGLFWKQCIPYEGNENLVGTTDKPKEE